VFGKKLNLMALPLPLPARGEGQGWGCAAIQKDLNNFPPLLVFQKVCIF